MGRLICKTSADTAGETNFVTAEMYDRLPQLEGPPPSNPKLPIIAAVDASTKRDSTAIIAVSIEHDTVSLVHDAIYQPRPDDPLDFEITIEKTLIDLSKRYFMRVCVFDEHQMTACSQRLKRLGLRMEEFPQTPANLISMSQNLFDLIRTQRLRVYPSKALRQAVLDTIAKEQSGGLKITKDRSAGKQTDATTALAMACLRAVQGAGQPRYRWDVWDSNYRDPDALPPPVVEEAELSDVPLYNGDWWRWRKIPRSRPSYSADDRLRGLYSAIDNASKWGILK